MTRSAAPRPSFACARACCAPWLVLFAPRPSLQMRRGLIFLALCVPWAIAFVPGAASPRLAAVPPQHRAAVVSSGDDTLPAVSIEYCTQCNWMLRSAWLAQELLTTFNGTLEVVSLVPNHNNGGVFEVQVATEAGVETVWSRADEGGFPESKVLKQRVRNLVDPERSLGHSDAPEARDDARTGGTRKGAVDRLLALLRIDRAKRR